MNKKFTFGLLAFLLALPNELTIISFILSSVSDLFLNLPWLDLIIDNFLVYILSVSSMTFGVYSYIKKESTLGGVLSTIAILSSILVILTIIVLRNIHIDLPPGAFS